MPTDRQLEQTISRWLEAEAPRQLPDRVLRATFERTRKTRQQVGWRALLRRLQVNRMFAALAGVAAVAVVALVAVGVYFNQPGGIGGVPPSPSPTAAPSPTAQPTQEPSPTATPAPTSTPAAGLPVGPFSFEPDGSFSPIDSGLTLTVTIPASGWTFDRTWNLLGTGPGDFDPYIAFWAFPDEQFYVPADPCRVDSTRPDTPATTVDEIAAALAAQASRNASEPVDVMIGGYAGKSLILHAPEDVADAECERGRVITYVADTLDFARNTQRPDEVSELWILDVDGTIVIIDALSRPDDPAELIEEIRRVVESTTFDTP